MATNCCQSTGLAELKSIEWRVRAMRSDDIEKCLDIWLQVELCEGKQTVASALATDPGGFYVAELTDTGEVIGMCAGILAREDTAFMGFYAVEPKYQGIGVGRELWATTIKRLDERVNIGLYGVPAMSEKYKKSGFRLEDTIRMLIFESKPNQLLDLSYLQGFDDLRDAKRSDTLELQQINLETNEATFSKLIDYDRRVNNFCREKLLRNYLMSHTEAPLTLALIRKNRGGHKLTCCESRASEREASQVDGLSRDDDSKLSTKMSGSLSLTAAASQDEVSKMGDEKEASEMDILGYGCIRQDNTDGAMVGPIYADSREVCEVLLRELLERFALPANGKYSIMSLTSSIQASEILQQIGLTEVDQCSRMFTKFVPEANYEKIFYVHSPNFSLF